MVMMMKTKMKEFFLYFFLWHCSFSGQLNLVPSSVHTHTHTRTRARACTPPHAKARTLTQRKRVNSSGHVRSQAVERSQRETSYCEDQAVSSFNRKPNKSASAFTFPDHLVVLFDSPKKGIICVPSLFVLRILPGIHIVAILDCFFYFLRHKKVNCL